MTTEKKIAIDMGVLDSLEVLANEAKTSFFQLDFTDPNDVEQAILELVDAEIEVDKDALSIFLNKILSNSVFLIKHHFDDEEFSIFLTKILAHIHYALIEENYGVRQTSIFTKLPMAGAAEVVLGNLSRIIEQGNSIGLNTVFLTDNTFSLRDQLHHVIKANSKNYYHCI